MTIKEWLFSLKKQYQNAAEFSNLDLELILSHVLNAKDRSYLVLRENDELEERQVELASAFARRRFIGEEPLAYILSEKEFYGRKFYVDKRVLIPRPETEQLIEITKKIASERNDRPTILDVGTGSGAIAITLKKELPELRIIASDLSEDALTVARRNAKTLDADVEFIQSDLLKEIDILPEIIVANLPYVDLTWDFVSKNLHFEPKEALFADDSGLSVIKQLIIELAKRLYGNEKRNNCFLILELDPSQKTDIRNYVKGISAKLPVSFAEQKFGSEFSYALCFQITRRK